MRKVIEISSVIVFLLALTGCSFGQTAERTPLESLPADYSLEQAKEDGCVVQENSIITSGQELWDSFVETVNSGKEVTVRLGFYYNLDPSRCDLGYYQSVKDDYPVLYIKDLTFDGMGYTIFGYEGNEEIVKKYHYLKKYEGVAESPSASYDSYVRYVLTNDDTVTWEQITHGLISSRFGDYIDHYTVYTELN